MRFERGTSAAERLAARRAADVEFERSVDLPQAQVVEVDGSVAAAVRRLERQSDVAYAQPNYIYRIQAPVPNDPRFTQLWGLDAINVLTAWDDSRGAGQVIAVVDSGVDLTHPDLDGNLWTNVAEFEGVDGVDDDANGVVDDVHGADFVDESSDLGADPDGTPDGGPDDFNFHGTHVAGTAAAEASNGEGIAGVAPDATIMGVRVLDADGSGTSEGVGLGIDYAAEQGADVVNLSLGGPAGDGDEFLSDAIAGAAAADAVVVAAAGNEGTNNDAAPRSPCVLPHLPQPPPNLICVAALGQSGQIASFSNWGQESVHLAAPGVGIWSVQANYGRIYPTDGSPDGFESASAFDADWTNYQLSDPWQRTATVGSVGLHSATDSPGGNYPPNADISLVTVQDYSLVGREGCRLHFDLRLAMGPGDVLEAGLLHGGSQLRTEDLGGNSQGAFEPFELSFRELDGNSLVAPSFRLLADSSGQADGAYVDEVELLCRASTGYGPQHYVAFSGTSMATPHVAGVVALARAAAPGETAEEIVEAMLQAVAPVSPTPGKPTVTGGAVDACRAVAVVRHLTPQCPTHWQAPPSGGGSQSTSGPQQAAGMSLPVSPPPKLLPDLRDAKRRIRVNRARRFVYSFRANPGLRGLAEFQTRRKAAVSAVEAARRAHLTIERRRFVVPADGKVKLRIRLSRREVRVLRRNGRLLLLVSVKVRDTLGRTATARKRLTLLAPRR